MYCHEDNVIRTADTPLDDSVLGGIGHVYFKYMKKYGDRKAQIDAITGETDTYHSLLKKCIRTSIVLSQRGIVKGDLIMYYSGIHLNACVPVVASYFIGSILSFLDTKLPLSEISYLLKQLKPKLLLSDPENFGTIKSLVKNLEIDVEIVVFYEDFFKKQDEETNFKPIYVNNLKETASIYFSSGSTGFPKPICLNHYSILCSKVTHDICKETENKVLLSFDSFYWTSESLRLISSTRQGACRLVYSQDFNATDIWNLIDTFKVDAVFLLPFDIKEMCKLGKPEGINISSLTTIVLVGSRLTKTYLDGLQEMFPDTDIFQFYGLTEVGLLTRFCKNKIHQEYNKKKIGSVGVPEQGYGISYRVVDPQTGENLGPNKTGELLVKSKTVMNGYYNLDSSDQFDKDGWFKTGDLVYYDEDYCFFIVDRIKNIIIYRGWHVAPAFLEDELLTHPAVNKAVVIGIPHDTDGEHPLAVVILNKNYDNTTPIEIENYVNDRVSDLYRLRGGVRFIDRMPLSPTRKIKLKELKKMVLSGEI